MTELLEVRLIDNGINTTPEALEIASNLHTELTAIVVVNSPATQAAAVAVAVQAQRFLKDVEASRKAVKEPVIEVGRKIDALAKELSEPVTAEMKRVGLMVAKFQQIEADRVRKEQQERAEAERKAMQAKFEAEEAARKAAAAMETEADLNAAIAAEAEAKRKQEQMYAQLTAPAPAPVKASGSINRQVLKYEVTDIAAAYAAAPHLFTLEISPSAVKATCNANSKVPGIRFWMENATSFKSY